jgi:hypothetical protein
LPVIGGWIKWSVASVCLPLSVDAKPMCGQWLMTKIRPLLLRIFDFHELLEFVLEVLSIFKIENQEREVH